MFESNTGVKNIINDKLIIRSTNSNGINIQITYDKFIDI
jgi:hypothetical protein